MDQMTETDIGNKSPQSKTGLHNDGMTFHKRIRTMAKEFSGEDVMAFPAASRRRNAEAEKRPRQKFWIYQFGLFLHDVMALYSAFWLTKGLISVPAAGQNGWAGYLWLVLSPFLVVPFLFSHNLYSYHLIFSLKKHNAALYRAMGWSGLSILFVAGQAAQPLLVVFYPKLTLAIGFAAIIGLIWFVRAFRGASHNLYRALGISLITVAVIHLVDTGQAAFLPHIAGNMFFGLMLACVLMAAGRNFIIETVYNGWLLRSFRRQVGIVGTNEAAERIASHIIDNNAPFWIAGTIGCGGRLNASIQKDCLGDIVEMPALSQENRLSDIIVTDEHLDKRTLISLMDFALSKGITVWFPPSVLPIIDRKIYIDNFCGMPMIRMCQQTRVVAYNRLRYALDALLALPLLALLLPVFAVIAAAIKINSKGPVFYRANAIGRDGQAFKMFKFRSMKVNNDASIHQQFVTKLIKGEIGTEGNNGQPLKITDDPRVTWVGKYLRKFSLDELPQLINVVLGQMSLIGPRPCLPYEYDVYQDWYKKRASIRPGITGLWQVAGRSEVAFEEMILLDLYYVYNRSIWMDFNILIKTVFVVLQNKGAY